MNVDRITRAIARLGFQSLGERIATNVVGVLILSSVGLVVLGFVVAFHACQRWLALPVLALCLFVGCARAPVVVESPAAVLRAAQVEVGEVLDLDAAGAAASSAVVTATAAQAATTAADRPSLRPWSDEEEAPATSDRPPLRPWSEQEGAAQP